MIDQETQTILAYEDVRENIEFLTRDERVRPYVNRVEWTDNINWLIKRLRQWPTDQEKPLVWLDLNNGKDSLPGLTALATVREEFPDVEVVVYTAYNKDERVVDFIKSIGGEGVTRLAKDLDRNAVREALLIVANLLRKMTNYSGKPRLEYEATITNVDKDSQEVELQYDSPANEVIVFKAPYSQIWSALGSEPSIDDIVVGSVYEVNALRGVYYRRPARFVTVTENAEIVEIEDNEDRYDAVDKLLGSPLFTKPVNPID